MKPATTNAWALLTATLILLGGVTAAAAQDAAADEQQVIFGVAVRAGGRYDDVRMCVATPAGVKGGPALDVSLFAEVGVGDGMSLLVNLPVMRPLLFAAAFKMLQFEPEVRLLFRHRSEGRVDVVGGPSLGLSMHYGPDYRSARSGAGRRPSFFALGPQVGGYVGLDFKRPGETFNFQLGLAPYVAPLFGVDDPDEHRGVVVGGMLDGQFRFGVD